jgi:DNA repair protein RecO (recombination protein O)
MLSIILSRRDFREFDQIISFYTQKHGKKEALARGIKKITSKNSAHLEPFSLVEVEFAHGKEIDHITKVVPVKYFKSIRQDLQKSLAASFVVSTTDKLLHTHEPDKRIFDLLKGWLISLNLQSAVCNLQFIDGYIVTLLHCLGYNMSSSGVPINHDSIYQFLLYHTDRKVIDWAGLTKL